MVNGFILIIENQRHSPQSMRPWLAMTHFDEPFDGMLIPLDQGATSQAIYNHTPPGKAPDLRHDDITIWE
jgi:glutathione S-transferase